MRDHNEDEQPDYDTQIREYEATPILTIRRKIPTHEIAAALGSILPAVYGAAHKALGAEANAFGAPFAIYHHFDEKEVDIEGGKATGRLLDSELAGEGELQARTLPAGKAAVACHVGPYDSLPETVHALATWMTQNGWTPAGPHRESYITDPGQEPDPTQWKTEIIWPVDADPKKEESP